MMQFLLNRSPWLFTRTQSIQKQVVEYEINSKYSEEYSTINKVGSEKRLAKKSVSCSINRVLISYLHSTQANEDFYIPWQKRRVEEPGKGYRHFWS